MFESASEERRQLLCRKLLDIYLPEGESLDLHLCYIKTLIYQLDQCGDTVDNKEFIHTVQVLSSNLLSLTIAMSTLLFFVSSLLHNSLASK
jgi:hypothetical protein